MGRCECVQNVRIALSDMSQMRASDGGETAEPQSPTAARSANRRSDAVVDDQLEQLKTSLSVESARIAEDRAWFDALMLSDDFL
uniref:Uncharacterized protein n=1 Tax=Plectus sambesii TaxID=2011161 RepID=A0A914V9U1_9BILA